MDAHAFARGRARQPLDKLAHVHARALAEHQPAVIGVGPQFLGQRGFRHHVGVRVDLARQQFLRTRQLVVVRGLGRELELAGPAEVAIDSLLADDPLDGVHASVEAAVQQVRAFGAEPRTHGGVVLGEAVVHMAAVAARGGASDTLGFQQHDLRALLCQRQSGGKAGKPAAHDDDVRATIWSSLHRPVEARSCVVPVRGELHCQPPKRGHSASTLSELPWTT